MFNKEFYPTPPHLINKMVAGLNVELINAILEPSAGKGDIIDALKQYFKNNGYRRNKEVNIDCIEIEPELQLILKGKNNRVVHDDFLAYSTFKRYYSYNVSSKLEDITKVFDYWCDCLLFYFGLLPFAKLTLIAVASQLHCLNSYRLSLSKFSIYPVAF
ncbi:MAG: hypothetical protein FWE22_01590 [Firmicutes bacterium]|nr:hypothetical protein [Bacillota bacterium]